MFYPKNTAGGNAGEYYFSYWVSRYFNWPCRLLDIDVGIDAQVEIFDNKAHSTGNFIAVQVKTTVKKSPNVSVTEENLKYWKSIDDIVVLVSISIAKVKPKLYWKVINGNDIDKFISKAKKNKSKTINISFDGTHLLTEGHKKEWYLLPFKGADSKVKELSEQIIQDCKNCNELYFDNKPFSTDNSGIEFRNLIDTFDSICHLIDPFEETIKLYPKLSSFVGSVEEAIEEYSFLKRNVENFLEYLFDVNSEWKSEYRDSWCNSNSHQILIEIVHEKLEA